MKKQSVSFLSLLLTASSCFFSCNSILNKNTQSFQIDSIRVNQTEHLFQDTAKPACNLVINFAYLKEATDSQAQDSLNNRFLTACFGEQAAGKTPQQAIENYTRQYISDYRKDLEPMYQKEEKESETSDMPIGAWYSYYRNIESHVQSLSDDLLVYRFRFDEYTGGAHGVYMTTYLNIDLRTLKQLTLDDLFTDNYQEPLTELLWNQLMEDNNVGSRQELEELGYGTSGELTPTENFHISKEGVTFCYNIYEIAPYVMGATEILLNWDLLKDIRNTQFELNL